ncbi:DMT family transporter [Pseudoroseomonas ludipueritiae]|uniref:DMT family transporter n=1 Tax=Pseudoroseomonas ludipueritiae TaxID=198093 RepID=A0ABR7R5M6_9PROT|nr:DMT family transporter [Pseudoroseomonas ludipueritiae]
MTKATPASGGDGFVPSFRAGLAAALLTVAMWTTWIIGSRFAMAGAQPLSPALLALVRFGTAALLLAPWWWRIRLVPRRAPKLALLGLLFAGLPYQFLVLYGLHFAPAAEAGPLLTGTLPMFIALLSALVFRERIGGIRAAGVVLITAGVLAITGSGLLDLAGGGWRGHLLILCAALSWSVYTVFFRRSGLTGTEAAAFVGFWSVVLLLPLAAGEIRAAYQATPTPVLLRQVLVQGVMAGVVALITFTTAVRHLGAARTSAITALTPAAVVAVAVLLLGEVPGWPELLGCALIIAGVVAASGALAPRRQPG